MCPPNCSASAPNSRPKTPRASLTFVVKRIENGKLTVDARHPLAGEHLTFVVTVNDLRDATPEEIRGGRPGTASSPLLQ